MIPALAAGTATCDVHPLKLKRFFFRNYNYLIVDRATRDAALVDASWEMEPIRARLEALDARLVAVLLTHSHYDHVNLSAELAKRYRPRVYMGAVEREHYGFRCPGLETFAHLDQVEVGETAVACLHTPGHTAGGACFLAAGALFTGDTVFTEGCGLCHAPGGCPHRMYESVQMLKRGIARDTAVYPGHSFGKEPGKPMAYLLENNIYFNIDQEAHFVEFVTRPSRREPAKAFGFR